MLDAHRVRHHATASSTAGFLHVRVMRHASHPMARRLTRLATLAAVAGAVAGAVACGSRGDAAADSATGAGATAAAAAATPATATQDTGMAGMDHSQMAATSRAAPKDSNQAFLRMMSDHHKGLVAMSDSAQPRLQGATAKADAQQLRQKQDAEQQRMLSMLSQQYGDSITPTILPSNRMMLDSVTRAAPGAEADRVYYRQVIAHHREGVQHVDMHRPHLTGEVKQMAERMRTEQQREIQEFERRASGPAGG